jgi:tRNA C32,U32 (ribose-2'-O)-methylase TrmJ
MPKKDLAYTLQNNQMDKKINNFLRAYGAESSIDKKSIIEKLLVQIGNKDESSKEELMKLVKTLSTKLKSEEDDLALIRKIIEEID